MSRWTDESNYQNDHRTRAANKAKWYKKFDKTTMQAVVEVALDDLDGPTALQDRRYDGGDVEYDEDEVVLVTVKFHFIVCPTCDGKGKHVNPSVDASGLTSEDFDEDPDFRENYFSGMYDVTCFGCAGENVVPEVSDPDDVVVRILEQRARMEAEWEAESAAERRWGA